MALGLVLPTVKVPVWVLGAEPDQKSELHCGGGSEGVYPRRMCVAGAHVFHVCAVGLRSGAGERVRWGREDREADRSPGAGAVGGEDTAL